MKLGRAPLLMYINFLKETQGLIYVVIVVTKLVQNYDFWNCIQYIKDFEYASLVDASKR